MHRVYHEGLVQVVKDGEDEFAEVGSQDLEKRMVKRLKFVTSDFRRDLEFILRCYEEVFRGVSGQKADDDEVGLPVGAWLKVWMLSF